MPGSSEEYLASLGFDTSDVDRAVNQTVTLLGHLGNQFDSVSGKASKAERVLLGTSKAQQAAATAAKGQTDATKRQADALHSLREQIYNQAQTFSRVTDAYEKASAAQSKMALTSPALRYALYDISLTAGLAATALTALGGAALVTAANYESAFTNVQRTLDTVDPTQVEAVRQSLLQLSREIPKSFGDISAIATLGNQLGIATDDVDEFTGTIARFSAVSGVSAEETAKVFGGLTSILGISSAEFENLGSAITLVGRKSAATDAEILSLTKEIGQQATAAGFAASDVVGLAGALGQLRVPPERSRGALTTYFQTLNAAVAEGGDKLEAFARVIGVTSGELETMVRSGRGTEVFQRFLASLQNLDNVDITSALDELGLSQLRVSDTFQRLASDAGTFNQYLGLSAGAYREGSELARQYALVVDDLASRWQLFLNALNEFAATVGAAVAPAAAVLLDAATKVLLVLAQIADTPMGKTLIAIAGGVSALAAVLLTLTAVGAAGVATLIAYRFALQQIGIEAATTGAGVRGLIATLIGLEAAATKGAIAMRIFRLALVTTGIGAIIAYLGFAIGLLVDFKGSVQSINQPLSFMIDVMFNLAAAILGAARAASEGLGNAFGWIPGVSQGVATLGAQISSLLGSLGGIESRARTGLGLGVDKNNASVKQFGALLGQGAVAMREVSAAAPGAASGIGDVGDAAGGAGAQVRTLVDYANDLQSVMKRAFDIRYGGAQATDEISAGWRAIREAIAQTNQQIAEYRAQMQTLSSDKAIREYWLRVAENYGDALRAGELRAEIAEIDAKLSKTSGDLTKAQQKNSKSLTGNTEAAEDNRETVLGLVQNYQDYITALAASGMPADQLARKVAQLKQEFIAQATSLGYSRVELEQYTVAFDDMAIAISRVPRNITVSANINPALTALAELQARAVSTAGAIGRSLGGALGTVPNTSQAVKDFQKMARLMRLQTQLAEYTGRAVGAAATGNGVAAATYNLLAKAIASIIQGGSYRSGTAWTGNGNPWDVAGVVHNREAVLNERGTRTVGQQFVNAANQGRNPWMFAPQQRSVTKFPSTMVVELSPLDREIMASGGTVTVVVAADDLAKATSASDADDNRRGGA